jgi:uncharacterized spore protein YtfJ
MSDTFSDFIQAIGKQREQNLGMLEKLLVAAQPGAVYSQPVSSGNYMVITASEVSAGGGFGGGLGFRKLSTDDEVSGDEGARPQRPESPRGGGGSGGGGGSAGRPVAVIIIGPDGVDVKPVIDATKIALAALTTLGAMVMTLKRMRKSSRG